VKCFHTVWCFKLATKSPDSSASLHLANYFLWGYLKSHVFQTQLATLDELKGQNQRSGSNCTTTDFMI